MATKRVGDVVAESDDKGMWCWTMLGARWAWKEGKPTGVLGCATVTGVIAPVSHTPTLRDAVYFSLGWMMGVQNMTKPPAF